MTESESTSTNSTTERKAWQAPAPTFWERTKTLGGFAYSKALKPGFDKAYVVVDKLQKPVNTLSNKVGSEAFWPTSLDKESEKCARILRAFCKDGFYDKMLEEEEARAVADRRDTTINTPKGKQLNLVKIPAKVIQKAVGLCIFTTMRTGWVIGGSGGSGIMIARHPETGEWSPPSGVTSQNMSIGFLIGIDIYDTILVINTYKALEAFTRLRCTLGAEVGVTAGPVGTGSTLDTEIHKMPAPVYSYVKARGAYAGVALAGNILIERGDENERFYGSRYKTEEILTGKVRHPPYDKYKILIDTLRAAEGQDVDPSLLPEGDAPGEQEVDLSQGSFGVPSADDDDPYGVKALEAEGLHIREAGSHQRPSAEIFEFNPSPSSPIYPSYRRSVDGLSLKRKTHSWRDSSASLQMLNRATDNPNANGHMETSSSPTRIQSRKSSLRHESPNSFGPVTPPANPTIHEENPIHQAKLAEEDKEPGTVYMKHDSMVVHGSDDEHTDDEDDDSDIEEAEIITAVAATARPTGRVVNVAKVVPPSLPPRNPGRVVPASSVNFVVRLKTAQDLPRNRLALRTSVDNWTKDHHGSFVDDTWHFDLDASEFNADFECKFIVLPNRWQHDPNLKINSPAAGEDITFTDSRVIFDPPTEDEEEQYQVSLSNAEALRVNQETALSVTGTDNEDDFVSVPPTPNEEKTEHDDQKAWTHPWMAKA